MSIAISSDIHIKELLSQTQYIVLQTITLKISSFSSARPLSIIEFIWRSHSQLYINLEIFAEWGLRNLVDSMLQRPSTLHSSWKLFDVWQRLQFLLRSHMMTMWSQPLKRPFSQKIIFTEQLVRSITLRLIRKRNTVPISGIPLNLIINNNSVFSCTLLKMTGYESFS